MSDTKFPPADDLNSRWNRLQELLMKEGADACLVASSVNIYYLTGIVFNGFFYLPVLGDPVYFVRRPEDMQHPLVMPIRKAEDIPGLLLKNNYKIPERVLLEADQMTYSEYVRLQAVFPDSETGNLTPLLRRQRMIKTPWEIEQLRYSGKIHVEVYSRVKACYRQGMTDVELQSNVEREMRLAGSIGLFRSFGSNMDIYMGSMLSGNNAEVPSPFDFALGGAGVHPSLPIGSDGSVLRAGTSLMVDMAGNYTAYITDMTRVFSVGKLPEKAYQAHRVSIDMHDWLFENAKPGTSCADIYNHTLQMAENAGLSGCFMGTKQQAKFVGHGVGIEVNELPVLMGRSKDLLQQGMTFAFEPKFVLSGVGAVGIENTYLVTGDGIEKMTIFEENIIEL
ncbi:MAG: Xaa-Pro peptidase family protein [Dysgonamonadaceae bacterium]|jgi:Xaa-Pro aminopeptidase|nr:Xaa-Pro peptidase family protein [Dysgonamonadaceae bacterium]